MADGTIRHRIQTNKKDDILNCGCKKVENKKAHSDFQHNKICKCTLMNKNGNYSIINVKQLSVWNR